MGGWSGKQFPGSLLNARALAVVRLTRQNKQPTIPSHMKLLLCVCAVVAASVGFAPSTNAANRNESSLPFIPAEAAYRSDVRDPIVRRVQLALRNRGYYTGVTTGEFVWETRHAIRRYRRDYGLPITGKIDAGLLRNLGLR